MATNPVSGNPVANIKLPGSYTAYVPAADFTNAAVAAKAVAGLGGSPVLKETTAAPGTPWGMPTINIPDTLRASVEAATGGRQTVLYDNAGNPSYMYVIPRFNVEDIHADLGSGIHPAFKNGGADVPYLFIGIVSAVNIGGKACAIPGRDPWTSINFDSARAACVDKGTGWHLMTNWEWAAITLWCLKNGYQPRGNTYYGRAHDATFETGSRYDGGVPGVTTGTARTKVGSGPASWRHDGTFGGIADLVGNTWEWQDGLKLVDGQVYMPNDNQFALAEGSWPAQGVYYDTTGTTGTDDVATANGAPVLSSARATPSDDCGNGLGPSAPDNDYATILLETGWRSVGLATAYNSIALATRQRMMQAHIAAIIASTGTAPFSAKGYISVRNYGERIPFRGGDWYTSSYAGLAALHLNDRRVRASSNIGFRPAFIG